MQSIDKLIDVLNGELGLYKDIYEIALKKTDIIVNGKTRELDHLTNAEGSILGALSNLEDKRVFILENYDGNKNVTLKELLEALPTDYRLALAKVQNDLILILNKLGERNNLNKSLLKQSIDYINYSLNFLTSSLEQDSITYGQKDVVKQHSSLIDKKA